MCKHLKSLSHAWLSIQVSWWNLEHLGSLLELSLSKKSLGSVLEQEVLSSCAWERKSPREVLEKFVLHSDYSEIPWKYKGTRLLLCCRRKFVLCLFSLSLSLYLCVLYLIHCIQTLNQNLHTSDSDQVLTHIKRNYKKPTQFNPHSSVFLTFNTDTNIRPDTNTEISIIIW